VKFHHENIEDDILNKEIVRCIKENCKNYQTINFLFEVVHSKTIMEFEQIQNEDEEKIKTKKNDQKFEVDEELLVDDDYIEYYRNVAKYTWDLKVICSDNKEIFTHKAILMSKSSYFDILFSGEYMVNF
jgi:negative regulator of replication initiation